MKKKIVAILLAVCLAVGCLPVPASAATFTGNREKLKDFLYYFLHWHESFDAEKAAFFGEGDVLYNFLSAPYQYNDSIYPGENVEYFYPYLFGNWPDEVPNPDFIPDPLGKFSYTGVNDYYWKVNGAKLDWIMKNIYNISEENISKMKVDFSDRDHYYYYEGHHYIQAGGSGGGPSGFAIAQIKQKGNLVYVVCDTNSREGEKVYLIVEPKTIDGNVYWTLHYAISSISYGRYG